MSIVIEDLPSALEEIERLRRGWDGSIRRVVEVCKENRRLEAEVSEARNEAAVVRRAYLHERGRAEDAIQWLRAYEPGPASVLESRAYQGLAQVLCSGKAHEEP